MGVTRGYPASLQAAMRKGVVLLVSLAAIASCTANGPLAPSAGHPTVSPTPSTSPTPTAVDSPSPSPSPSPIAPPSPIAVPSWAALHASCAGSPAPQEAVLKLQGAANPVLADVSSAKSPRTLCGISGGSFQLQLVTQTMISWYATQGNPSGAGTSSLAFRLPKGTMATWGSAGSRLYYRIPSSSLVQVWDSKAGVSQALPKQLSWIRPRADAGDDNIAFTVRDSAGTPHVWLYGHGGQTGGQLPNVRSSPIWLNSTELFYVEEAVCSTNCGIGPAWQPDGKTFTFEDAQQPDT